jgi:site-specific DNA recombinase
VKRCAIYARYSSDLQSPMSIQDQLQLCRAYADRHGWTVVAAFEDAAISGFGVEQRPGYRHLVATALANPKALDVVLVEDLSRLTRDVAEAMRLHQRLRLRGVDIIGVSDGIDTGRRGATMHVGLKGLMNNLYLEDLGEKTHRGLLGQLARGLSAGGKLFGYRTVPVPGEAPAGSRKLPVRFEIDPDEAEIVRRIFGAYAVGRSMKAIAHQRNAERIPFPAKDTKRGPVRRGWAVSTIQVMLRNDKYAGLWVWNKTRFLKDPETGRRRPVERPRHEWVIQERPELRIIDPPLWAAVQARLAQMEQSYGVIGGGRPPRGDAHVAYSKYLLSGLLRCAACGARMIAQTATRRRRGKVYSYGWYRCGFAANKGPTVCGHRVWYRQDRLEAALVGRFREAITPARVEALAAAINARVLAAYQQRDSRADQVTAQILRVEGEAGRLVRALREGLDFPTVRTELQAAEETLEALRIELAEIDATVETPAPCVHPSWIWARLEELDCLLREDAPRARLEIQRHLDGDLAIRALPSEAGASQHPFEIVGHVKGDSLLAVGQEAVRLRVVAGAGFEPTTFGLNQCATNNDS